MSVNSKRLRTTITSFNNTTVYSSGYIDGQYDLTNHKTYAFTVVLAGTSITGSVKIQHSDDGTTWGDVASSSQNYSAAGGLFFEGTANHALYRVALISGDTDAVTAEIYGVAKEN